MWYNIIWIGIWAPTFWRISTWTTLPIEAACSSVIAVTVYRSTQLPLQKFWISPMSTWTFKIHVPHIDISETSVYWNVMMYRCRSGSSVFWRNVLPSEPLKEWQNVTSQKTWILIWMAWFCLHRCDTQESFMYKFFQQESHFMFMGPCSAILCQ